VTSPRPAHATSLSRAVARGGDSRPERGQFRRARTLLWTLIVRPLLIPLSMAPASCVVTSTPVFQETDDCPPDFRINEASPPSDAVFRIDTTATVPLEFNATVPLRSCALAKVYKGRIFLDGHIYTEIDIPATGESTRAPTPINVAGLSLGCHTVQVYASTAFAPDTTFKTPVKQGDLATINWFLYVFQSGAPLPDACR
jgi:hypothetical protein